MKTHIILNIRNMTKLFFTADTHLGHGNIIKYSNRPFLTVADQKALEENGGTWKGSFWKMTREAIDMMNDTIINNINSIVGENDILWHMGDFAFAPKDSYARTCENYRRRIKCKNMNIIWGNHDEPHLIHHLFKETHKLHDIYVPNERFRIVLCHYAMAVWEGSHRGNWQLYGHSHMSAEPWLNKVMPGRRSVDVGVDNANLLFGSYSPISLDELQKLFSKRDGFSIDHHVEKRNG